MYSDHAECPFCNSKIKIDMTEPGSWCSADNMPDGEYNDKCGACGKHVIIIVQWRPYFDAGKPEDY